MKQESVNWRDTNVGLLGSDLEKKIKKAAAEGEPQWVGVGKHPGLQVWRIEQFRVVKWPERKHGQFHEGCYHPAPSSTCSQPLAIYRRRLIGRGITCSAKQLPPSAYHIFLCQPTSFF